MQRPQSLPEIGEMCMHCCARNGETCGLGAVVGSEHYNCVKAAALDCVGDASDQRLAHYR